MIQQLAGVRPATACEIPRAAAERLPLGLIVGGRVKVEEGVHRLRRAAVNVGGLAGSARIPPDDVVVREGGGLEAVHHLLAGTARATGIDEEGRLRRRLRWLALEGQGNRRTIRIIPVQRHENLGTLEVPARMPRNLARQVSVHPLTGWRLAELLVVLRCGVHGLAVRALRTLQVGMGLGIERSDRRVRVSFPLGQLD